jgi:hypothetical protein
VANDPLTIPVRAAVMRWSATRQGRSGVPARTAIQGAMSSDRR